MPGIFPSLCGFGGVKGIGKLKAKTERIPQDQSGDENLIVGKLLSELNSGYSRMVDSFVYDYPQLVRDDSNAFANVKEEFQENVKVAIIGAGYAGATAAYELRRAGIKNITVYEARRKDGEALVGGRAYSPKFTGNNNKEYTNEMGPMRVPENSKLFWHYFSNVWEKSNPGEPDKIQEIFPNPGVVATQIIFRGLKYSWKDEPFPQPEDPGNPNNVNWEQLQSDIGEFIGSLNYGDHNNVDSIANLLQEELLNCEQKNQIIDYWNYFLRIYNDVPFVKALEDYFEERWGEEQYNMFAVLGLGSGGFGPLFPVCFLEIFRLLLWQYDQEYSPSMAMADIVNGLLEYNHGDGASPGVTICNETVDYVGIDQDDTNQVNVYSIQTGTPNNTVECKQYDYVIVATTLRSMQIRMNLDAKVPPRDYGVANSNYNKSTAVFGGDEDYKIRDSMRIPHIMNSSKLFGLIDPKPWAGSTGIKGWPTHPPNDPCGEPIKCVLTDTLARQMYFLDPPDNPASNVLISYNWGDDSTKIMAIQDYEAHQTLYPDNPDYALKKAYQFGIEGSLGQDDPIVLALDSITLDQAGDRLASVVWQKEPMIYGAFKMNYPNQYYATSQLVYQYQQLNKRVYLAGNNCSFQGGWIEGAMQSAVNASAAVLKHMQAEGKAENFRMDDLFSPNPFENVLDELENS
ncbi:FAD-dependent oxidoreductase [Okeania sp. KiyG1]|uniref:flavin monoamine oxidase family protein n=1 Tax=Okeania sp. KiyG1 TaxID=2720165 RepID=UPI001923C3AE|nr:FAD-dependent oxidoreductase [Okeania sp. KiyG1]GGA58838.1 hypothetical protein CYANOKiyG1_80140 [Okeania sp. KiyG1]